MKLHIDRSMLSIALVLCGPILTAQVAVNSSVTGLTIENTADSTVTNSSTNEVLPTAGASQGGSASLSLRLNQLQTSQLPNQEENGSQPSYNSKLAVGSQMQTFTSATSIRPESRGSSIMMMPSHSTISKLPSISSRSASSISSLNSIGKGSIHGSSNSHVMTPAQSILLQGSGMETLSPSLRRRADALQEHHPLMLKMKQQMLGIPRGRSMQRPGHDIHPRD